MDPTYEGWDEERDSIIDDTLGAIRDQRDDESESQFAGSFPINPNVMLAGQAIMVGPILFEEPFSGKPNVTFGQAVESSTLSLGVPTSASIPFLVIPFVHTFIFNNGQVDGFYLGLYALTSVPAGTTTHTIDWKAIGKGSPYHQEQLQESWSDSYDYNEADYLVEEAENDEDF